MQTAKIIKKSLEGSEKKAFIVGEETKICELVSLILEDLGFKSMQVSQTEWLVETMAHVHPELIVWDLNDEKKLSPFQSLSELREQASMKKVKIMLLGGPDVKKDLENSKGDARIHFCMKPFSPTALKHEIEQLYGTEA